jgi:multidrug resistance efflux pump
MRKRIVPAALMAALAVLPAARADDKPPAAGAEITRQPGSVVPATTERISPQVAGTVREVLAHEGDAVKAGQVLARLDRREADLDVKRAEAAVERAKAAVGEAKARVVRQRADVDGGEAAVKEAAAERQAQRQKLDRMRDLLKNRAIEQRLVDEREAQVQVAAARLHQAEAQLAALRAEPVRERLAVAKADLGVAAAQLELARFQLDGTEVHSPIAGTVLARHATAGESVAPLSDGRPVVLFEVADLSRLEVAIQVPDRDVNRIAVGLPCEVRIDAVPGQVIKGRVARVAPALSEATRTAAVRVSLDGGETRPTLRPGMYGIVRVLAR